MTMPSLKSFYRFNLRLLILTIIGFVLSNSVYSQLQVKAKYSENETKSSKVSSAKIRLDDETQTPHTLVGGFYTTRNGFESKLMMNNKGPQPIEVAPTLYGENGAIMQMPTVTVERNSFITVNLRDWVDFAGEAFRQGNIRLFHRGKDLVLGCNMLIIDESKSLIFENKFSELGNFDSRRLEGVWYIPNNDTDSTVVLTNTSDEFLTVTATLTKNPHNSSSAQTFTLLPHEVKVLDVRRDFPQGNVFAGAKVLGLSLAHDGAEESLLAWTMIKDESKGYSNIATFTNPVKAKSNQYHGAGLQLGSVGDDELEPVVVLRNTTDAKVDVKIKVPYTKEGGSKQTLSVNTVKLNAREVHLVNMQRAANLRNVKAAGIEIEYTGNPGSVVASAQSVSKSGTQVFRTLLWDAPALKSASSLYPFTIEGTSSTKAYIKNAGFKDEVYVSHITWGTDGEYFIPIKTIKEGETVEIDVKKLRDEQIPDERGRTIPLNISKGQIHWLLRRSDTTKEAALENKVPLVGQALQIDTSKGVQYSYFCLSCCEYGAYSFGTLVPSNAQAQHPVSFQYRILEDGRDCYGNGIYSRDITVLGYDWTSTNPSVATVSGGYATTQGGGQTQIKVKVNLPDYWTYGLCDGGGGPYFAGVKDSDQECDENVRPAKLRDTQSVSFSKIAYKKESKRNFALRPDDCDCMTYSPTETLTANLKVYQVIIKRDGQPVTTSNNTTIVGERINLTAEVIPSGTTVSNHSWTLQGNIIKNYSPTPQSYQTGSVIPAQLNIPNPDFVWVDGGNGRSVQYNATVNGQTLTSQVFFNVERPITQINASSTAATATDYATGNYEVHLGVDSYNPGIRFNRGNTTVPSPFTGDFQWVQLIDSLNFSSTSNNQPVIINGVSGLDEAYPYSSSTNTTDSPGIQLAMFTNNIDFDTTWTMYLMFKPNSTGSEWVPLRKVTWRWKWTSTENSGVWTTNPTIEPRNLTLTDSDATAHPIWSTVINP